ncbi:MAG: signal peptidase II [Spirochaetales bacterium]|nr:MAG: signal peptidase II [Spirochaetales bacterium]
MLIYRIRGIFNTLLVRPNRLQESRLRRHAFIIASILGVTANYLADRLTKILALRYLSDGRVISFMKNTVVIALSENEGAFLGLGADWPVAIKYALFLVVPIAACFYGLYYAMFKETDRIRVILISTVVGGGLGNLVDRLFNGFRVVDFLNFGIGSLRTGVLNVADLSVTIGAVLLIVHEYRSGKKKA